MEMKIYNAHKNVSNSSSSMILQTTHFDLSSIRERYMSLNKTRSLSLSLLSEKSFAHL